MKKLFLVTLIMSFLSGATFAQTEISIFVGSLAATDLLEEFAQQYEAQHPDVDIQFEIGGVTSEQQQQYLNTVLTSKSSEIDLFLIDVIRPATFAAAGWAEPLDAYFASEEEKADYLAQFLPGVVAANTVDGQLYALPGYTDAQFLYYRTDLLEKYGFEPPTTWAELKEQALTIMEGENNPNLQGFNYQGAAIEGANCTFLEPLWTAGGDWQDADGNITVNTPEGRQVLEWYQETLDSGITKANIAETGTDNSRQEFQAGDVIFMLNWGYAWARFKDDEDSQVKGKFSVTPLPAFEGHESATCVGGWQWAINPYSEHKDLAFAVARFYTDVEFQRQHAIQASRIPVRMSLYEDPEVLEANPHFAEFYDVIVNARPRPVTPFYSEVSELIRTSMNAFLAGSMDIDETLETMQFGLEDIFSN